jgi:hypothetical protein
MSTRSGKFVDIDKVEIKELQQIYNAYSKAIELELQSAVACGTVVSSGSLQLSVGLSGLFIVTNHDVIRTAYFPTWSSIREFDCTSFIHSKKRKRDKERKIKSRKKLIAKGSDEKQLFRLGIKSTHRMFAKSQAKDKDYLLKKKLACLISENVPLIFQDWEKAYLDRRFYTLMQRFDAA